jgi:hypothetical protein
MIGRGPTPLQPQGPFLREGVAVRGVYLASISRKCSWPLPGDAAEFLLRDRQTHPWLSCAAWPSKYVSLDAAALPSRRRRASDCSGPGQGLPGAGTEGNGGGSNGRRQVDP